MAGRVVPPAIQGGQPPRPGTHETSELLTKLHSGRFMNLPGQLNPPPRLLLGPGPSDAHPRVLTAMATPLLGHLDPQFLAIMSETQSVLRAVMQTNNRWTFPVSATGMAGMEACVVNLIEPGDKMIVCTAGFFGGRIVEIAGRAGAAVTA